MLDRLLNIFFFFSLLFVFLIFSEGPEQLRFFIAIVLAGLCGVLAFVLNWLSLDGATAAVLFGIIAFGFGGITGAVIVLAFFVSSSLISKDVFDEDGFLESNSRRDGLQVWSNGFWFAIWVIIWFITENFAFMIAAASSMAFATSDTWASEVGGHRVRGKTWLITNFKKVAPSTDGAISVAGTFASLIGAVFIALIFWLMEMDSNLFVILLIAISGFLGSFVDSLFGATVQGKSLNKFGKAIFANRMSRFDNNITNWVAGGSASVIALILVLFIGQ